MEERVRVYWLAKRRYKEMLKKDAEREMPLDKGEEWNRNKRIKAKELKKKTWFKGSREDSEAVFFVRSTPGRALAERCRGEFRWSGLKIKVVERIVRSVKSCLVRSNPFRKAGCGRENCVVCNLEGNLDCRARNIHYKILCNGVRRTL